MSADQISDKILDAQDDLSIARDLVVLLSMTARNDPDDDMKAISAGCEAALERISRVEQRLDEVAAVFDGHGDLLEGVMRAKVDTDGLQADLNQLETRLSALEKGVTE